MCYHPSGKTLKSSSSFALSCVLRQAGLLVCLLHSWGFRGTNSSTPFLGRQDVFALPQPLWWFSLFQNSMIPTGLAWEDMLYPLYQKYKNAITWGDQDLLNIIFYFNPGRLPCKNAICVGVHPPLLTEHIPVWSTIDWAWIVSGVPLWSALFHSPPAPQASARGRPSCCWHKRPNVETSNTGLHFWRISFRFCHTILLRSVVKISGRAQNWMTTL